MDHHRCQMMNPKSMLDIFHPHHHERQHFSHVYVWCLVFALALPMASSCLAIGFDDDHVVADEDMLLLLCAVQSHSRTLPGPMSKNDFLKLADDYSWCYGLENHHENLL